MTNVLNKKIAKETLRIFVQKIGFKHKTIDKRQVIRESRRLTMWRYNYLKKIEEYRNQKRPVIYLDETWFDTHDTVKKGWTDGSNRCRLDVPSNRGKRIIILHAGSEQGFVKNALLLSAKNIKNAKLDYHEDMSADLFEQWFAESLLPNIPPNSVIILDNASYHSRLLERIPTKNSTKKEIINFLYKHDLFFEEGYTKSQLIEVMNTKNFEKRYVIDHLASESGFTVLRLPPYHCEYNAIEQVWSELKRKIRKRNTIPKFSESTVKIIQEVIGEITT